MYDTLEDLFAHLDESDYAVLRNFDQLPHSVGKHADIDLICDDADDLAERLGTALRYGVRGDVTVAGRLIPVDVRQVGDRYFDARWQQAVLDRRICRDGVWTLNDDDHRWTLLYHVLVHKRRLAADYKPVLAPLASSPRMRRTDWMRVLRGYMRRHRYVFTQPSDYDYQNPLMERLWGRS